MASPTLIQYHTEQSESVRGQSATKTPWTVTSHDREALTLTHICEFKGQDIGQDEGMPLRTITANAREFAEICTEVRTCGLGRIYCTGRRYGRS